MKENDLFLLRNRLVEIKEMGWIENRRPGNAGGVGNTLEDLLGIAENNYQRPDFGFWELKSQRADSSSLLTLFHCEPKPRNARVVARILLEKYGWPHQEAGIRYPINEKSFRQTINNTMYSDRGFTVNLDDRQEIVYISFDYSRIDDRHALWRNSVLHNAGSGDILPNPYWTYSDIESKLRTKLNNMMYVRADRRVENGKEYFCYNQMEVFVNPSIDRFLELMRAGAIYVDFDARTGHNHGTKFRIRQNAKESLYAGHFII